MKELKTVSRRLTRNEKKAITGGRSSGLVNCGMAGLCSTIACAMEIARGNCKCYPGGGCGTAM